MIATFFIILIWSCNAIFSMLNYQYEFKIYKELFLEGRRVCLNEFILHWKILFQKITKLFPFVPSSIVFCQCIMYVLDLNLQVTIQHQDLYEISFFIYTLTLFDRGLNPMQIKIIRIYQLVNIFLLGTFASIIQFNYGQPIILCVITLIYIQLQPKVCSERIIRKSEQTIEDTLYVRSNSNSDRFPDPINALVAIIRLDHQLKCLSQNQRAQELLKGIEIDDILDSNVYIMDKQTTTLLSENNYTQKIPSLQDIREQNIFHKLRDIIHMVEQTFTPCSFEVFNLQNFGDFYFKIYSIDIKTTYILIQDLKEYNFTIKKIHTQHTMEQLFKSFSHEFNTSLNYILAIGQVAESATGVCQDVQQKFFHPIVCAGKLMHSIISDIMDYKSIVQKSFNLQVASFSVTELIEEVMDLFQEQIKRKKLEFRFINNILKNQIVSDKNRIKQVLANLVSNAQKFTLQGSIIIQIDNKVEGNCYFLQFTVFDTGIGMNYEEQERLRNLLSSGVILSKNGNSPQGLKISQNCAGFGLGLFISNKIAQALSSHKKEGIQFESEPQKGFRCWFSVKNQLISQADSQYAKTPLIVLNNKTVLDVRQTEIMKKIRSKRVNANPMREKFAPLLGLKEFSPIQEPQKSQGEIKIRRNHHESKIKNELKLAVRRSTLQYDKSERQQDPKINQECNEQERDERQKYFIELGKPASNFKQDFVIESQSCECPKILIVDDEQINIMAMQLMLEQLGLKSDSVFNGQECVDLIYSKKKKTYCRQCQLKQYDLIFMDINMPILDGIEASKEIKKYYSPIIIACSAYIDKETKDLCYSNGVDYYLSKPVKKAQLKEVLEFYNFF